MQAVFDGDAGLGQRIANLIGLGKVPSLAGFGTGIELFGNKRFQCGVLGGLGRAIAGTTGSSGRECEYIRSFYASR